MQNRDPVGFDDQPGLGIAAGQQTVLGSGGFLSIAAAGLMSTLEVFDNATSKMQFVLTAFGSPYAWMLTGVLTPGSVVP